MTPFKETFRKAREANGYSLEETAHLLQITPALVAKYEAGTALPSMDMVLFIERYLGINVGPTWCAVLYEKATTVTLKAVIEEILKKHEAKAEDFDGLPMVTGTGEVQ